jgi:LAO/AO transport system kinase
MGKRRVVLERQLQARSMAADIKKGDRRAIAKGITLLENGDPDSSGLMRLLDPPMRAFVLGITGPPGTGKSTLVDRLIGAYREKGLKVGVIAVDPTSPITGGALLGDRIRMGAHAGDRGVYIRSMATRGWSGGLSRAASNAIQLLDSAGFDVVLLETAGIGQSDIEVVAIAHAVLVVLMPGLGDEVQASKAGLMEVGDVYVVNKSDLEGADAAVVNILSMVRGSKSRSPAVVKVSAISGDGVEKLVESIESIRKRFEGGAPDLRLRSAKGMVIETARGAAMGRLKAASDARAEGLAKLVVAGRLTVEEAASRLAL